MPRETTHSAECWRWHESCSQTVLDEAANAVMYARQDAHDQRREPTYHETAAAVLRVAADRLRARADKANLPDSWGLYRAADMLSEGTDHAM